MIVPDAIDKYAGHNWVVRGRQPMGEFQPVVGRSALLVIGDSGPGWRAESIENRGRSRRYLWSFFRMISTHEQMVDGPRIRAFEGGGDLLQWGRLFLFALFDGLPERFGSRGERGKSFLQPGRVDVHEGSVSFKQRLHAVGAFLFPGVERF